ncbi:MAG TPA: non-ribosomal peptide synthetase [Micromonosporaceae bacterium]|nr:non-ribosomal peptide synthetase [Micromonosporaceae bacterium]HCU49299.1 non-ribosomal peptide synthetase [Micromonosporaceae bacterium]
MTTLAFPDRRFADLVAEHAKLRPEAVAIQQWQETVTYQELCGTAGELAAELTRRGAGPGVLIGVCADRQPEMVAGLLGVLMTGAGYVPLDPSLPKARLQDMASEAGLTTFVCDPVGLKHFSTGVPVPGWRQEGTWPLCPAKADDLAYVMFTSGSTGRPKGVMISQDSLTEFVTNLAAVADLGHDCRSLAFSSIGFDASVIDILTPLAAGGTVALVGSADRADPTRLQRFCAEHRVTVAFLPPAVLPILDPVGLPSMRVVLTGSEAPGPEQVARWTTDGRRFLNLFGPTEMTVYVTWFEASGSWDKPLPIGRPAANHRVYVVTDEMRLAEVGEPGELWAGGSGLAKGYLGDPELTAEKFVPDPFSGAANGFADAKLYRTGDLVSWMPDGTLQFIGRVDRQIKIRGQRIEIGEVEAVLRGHPDVEHAAVAVAPGPSLVAFVTGGASPEKLREHCAASLPAAMVPTTVLVLSELPLLSTGKVDLDHLLSMVPTVSQPSASPETPVEQEIAVVWAELLGRSDVGRDDDFFDAGGHSITAMRLVASLRSRLSRDVAIEDVLEGRTLRAIASRVTGAPSLGSEKPVRGRPPALSPSQQRLWFLDRYSPAAAAAYNITLAERLRGPLDLTALQSALTAVAERQQVLRWRIPSTEGVPYAVLDEPNVVPLPVIDLSSERELAGLLSAEVSRKFELGTDALWYNRVFRLGPEDHVLAITAHHAVFDGWSQSLLYNDLAAAYEGKSLPALPATYADYVAWREERRAQRADEDLGWWTSHLAGVPTVLELPNDRPRPVEQSFAGGHVGSWLEADTTTELQRFAGRLGATPSAVLLAAFGVVLARLADQTDLVIGSPMVDRRHQDFEEMVGFFIEIAPLRLRMAADRSFAEHVRAARDELIAALAHPEAPLERIVHAFGLGGQVARNPLVQVLFNVFNFAAPKLDLGGTVSESVPVQVPGSAFDLTLYGVERDGRMRLEIVYNTDLFDELRMSGLLESLREVIVQGMAAEDVVGLPLNEAPAGVPRARPRPSRLDTPFADPPATATERSIAAVWCEVLGLAEVGVTENFFDSGGGSLAIVVVQQRLNRLMGSNLRVVDLFRHPTIRALGAHLDGADDAADAIEIAMRRGAARRGRRRGGNDG